MAVQRCSRCGTARRGDLQVCVRCETPFAPAGGDGLGDLDAALPRPAAPSHTQSHGTVLVAVLVGFVLLAVLLKLSIRGIGPFDVSRVDATKSGDTLRITLDITNTGDRTGRANCRIPLRDETGVVQSPKTVITERIQPGETVREVVSVPLGDGVQTGEISC